MTKRTSLFQKIASSSIGVAMVFVLFLSSGLSAPLPVAAQALPDPTFVVTPCGSAPGVQNACEYYQYFKDLNAAIAAQLLHTWQFAVGTAILNGLSYFTQRIAVDMADWALSGFTGGGPAFYRKGFSGFLEDIGTQTLNVMITSMAKSDFLQQEIGINICVPISLNLKLALGLSKNLRNFDQSCGYALIAANFEQTYRSLNPNDLTQNLKNMIQPGGNGVSVSLFSNQKLINTYLKQANAAILDRQEGGGFKLLTDLISNRIQTPAQVMKDNIANSNPLKMMLETQSLDVNVLAGQAFVAGLQQLPQFAAGAFLNTLAVGLVQKLFDYLRAGRVMTR